MKPARFDYVRAQSVEEIHALLAAEGSDASVLAGGQTLVPLLSMRMARPKVVVDIMHLPELGGITLTEQSIRVGAAVRQAELSTGPTSRSASRCWHSRSRGWVTRKRARAARSPARSHSRIRAQSFRW